MAGRRPTNAREQRARLDQERARAYAARRDWHAGIQRRRLRDNAVAIVAGSIVVLAAIVSQVVHAEVTAPAPKPTPSATTTPTPSPVPSTVAPATTPPAG
ncbi:hypothetical protein [uncultured Microbacterium sp.]|uniref:hypothetical protein n=1 Tax=uncultured Microbacterium sp. TaxID=191216 RepID=UPI0025DF7749|nr:hypothetical protein [uncultured Microbacterium sp.]